ncbi:hypothetical protein EJ04DRAFT_565737 [Polyplosphaeria fusca]|uniref:Uncharacterized protein n=1 Tax=Polyplosphaeria fusca TaxID=682080 RepID=A0A9P4QUL5_9PLEO|nr:hypothetical protein EJ04DRAFT_565737 [Polyplosphaeria fusca]
MLSPILSALLLGSAVSAAAVAKPAIKRDDAGPTVWKSPDGGNTQVRFGDGKVYIGACTPQDIINTVYDNCYDEGFCNSESWTVQCTEDDDTTHTITITAPEGQYQPWIKNGLVEAIQAAIGTSGVTDEQSTVAMSGGGCVGCPWTGTDINVYHMPATLGVAHDNDGSVPDVITLNIVNNDDSDGEGLCEILTGIGAGIAGAVNGAAGGIFTLASVACKAI